MSNSSDIHLYGTADPKHPSDPPEAGFRGEAAPISSRPELSREKTLATGSTVRIEHQSGVAFAEATGATGVPQGAVQHAGPPGTQDEGETDRGSQCSTKASNAGSSRKTS